jgi:hypothetical protein
MDDTFLRSLFDSNEQIPIQLLIALLHKIGHHALVYQKSSLGAHGQLMVVVVWADTLLDMKAILTFLPFVVLDIWYVFTNIHPTFCQCHCRIVFWILTIFCFRFQRTKPRRLSHLCKPGLTMLITKPMIKIVLVQIIE